MKLNVTFKHLDRSEALETHIKDSVDAIARFLLREAQGSVLCSKTNHQFRIEISVNTREKYFRAFASHENPYLAVDSVVERLHRQFLKNRKLQQNHHKPDLVKSRRADLSQRYKKAA